MADETTGLTESAASEASTRVESAPEPVHSFPDLADILAAEDGETPAKAVKDADADDDEDADEVASDEAPQKAGDTSDDASPGTESDQPKLSRREQRELERQQEIERHRTEAQQARDEAEKTKSDLARDRQQALALLGSDDEYNRLVQKRLDPSQILDYDEEQSYTAMHAERQHAATWLGMAKQSIRADDQEALTATAKEFNLDPKEYIGVDPATAVRKAVAATETRVRKESADRIAELEASETSLVTQLAGKSKSIGPGGQSDSASRHAGMAWDPQKRGSENLDAALESWIGEGVA